jgi:hypothetical protein
MVAEVRRQTDRMIEATLMIEVALQGPSDQAAERYREFEESINERLRALPKRHRVLQEEWDAFGAGLVECLGAVATESASHRLATTDENGHEAHGMEWTNQLEPAPQES